MSAFRSPKGLWAQTGWKPLAVIVAALALLPAAIALPLRLWLEAQPPALPGAEGGDWLLVAQLATVSPLVLLPMLVMIGYSASALMRARRYGWAMAALSGGFIAGIAPLVLGLGLQVLAGSVLTGGLLALALRGLLWLLRRSIFSKAKANP